MDQWNQIIQQLGSPSQEFISRLQCPIRNYIERLTNYPGHPFELLFPDHLFPQNSSNDRLTGNRSFKLILVDLKFIKILL